jgi:hypothetical protein
MPTAHAPPPYEYNSEDFQAELAGRFRVLHTDDKKPESTWDKPRLTPLEWVSERPLRWLWDKKIPLGKLTLIEGPPCVGKLYVALDIAARASTGALCVEKDFRSIGTPPAKNDDGGSKIEDGVSPPMTRECQLPDDVGSQTGTGSTSASPPGPPFVRGGVAAPEGDNPTGAVPVEIPNCYKSNDPPPVRYVPPPDYVPPPPDPPPSEGRPVVVICDEWEAQDMILPRLKLLGAKQENVALFTGVSRDDGCNFHKRIRPIEFPLDLMMFSYILRKHRRCKLIVIDNLEKYCATPKQMRQAIKQLDDAAQYYDVAIVATMQGNVRVAKDGTIRDTARTADGLARCIWSITHDPSHPGLLRFEPKRMAFCQKPQGIAFRISDFGQVVWEPLPQYEKPPTEAAQRKRLEHTRLLTWLAGTLGTGVVHSEQIYDAGAEQGFSRNKLRAVRIELGARKFKTGFGKTGAWMWTFKPDSEITAAEVQDAFFGVGVPPSGSGRAPTSPLRAGQNGEGRRQKREERNGKNSGDLSETGGKIGDLGHRPKGKKSRYERAQQRRDRLSQVAHRPCGKTGAYRNGHQRIDHAGNGHAQNGQSE